MLSEWFWCGYTESGWYFTNQIVLLLLENQDMTALKPAKIAPPALRLVLKNIFLPTHPAARYRLYQALTKVIACDRFLIS